jgi:hypothetical protein
MKLFLTVALSLMMIALLAHAQSLPPAYPAPPPNYPPPAYAPPPPPPEPGVMLPAPGTTRVIPPQPPYTPQQAMPPVMPQVQNQPQPPAGPALQAQQQGDITFVSGGAGTEDRDALRQVETQYNLRLLFAARNGDYLADVAVTLSNARGTVLDTIAEGPIFYARVPPGRYRLTVSNQGQSQSRDISIGNGAVRQDFYWASAG